jgi:hypothetical protein
VHERGATHVEVTEHGTGPAWFAWERSRYDWSEPDRIRQTYLRQALKAVEASERLR